MIDEIEKNSQQKIRISIELYNNHHYVDVRVYYRNENGEWHPTKKGITLNDETIDPVIKALRKARRKLGG